MSFLIDPTSSILTKALDGLTRRQSLISSNLANIDTPGYQPQALDFESTLQAEAQAMTEPRGPMTAPSSGPTADVGLLTTDPRHFATPVASSVSGTGDVQGFEGSIRNDGNQVDLESEMTALSDTQLKYSATTRLLNSKFSQLLDVIGGK